MTLTEAATLLRERRAAIRTGGAMDAIRDASDFQVALTMGVAALEASEDLRAQLGTALAEVERLRAKYVATALAVDSTDNGHDR